jgi:biotin carboxyl carrier protein
MILHIAIDGVLRKLTLERTSEDGGFTCEIDGQILTGSASLLAPGILSLLIGLDSYRCVFDPGPSEGGEESAVYVNGQRYGYRREDPRSLKARRSHLKDDQGPRSIKAPMPGRVVGLLVAEGDEVEAQQGVLTVEAMKMQNELKAPKAGRVVQLRVKPGATVTVGEVLAIID